MKIVFNIIALSLVLALFSMTPTSCGTSKKDNTATTTHHHGPKVENRQEGGPRDNRKGPPPFSELLEKMDQNGDGKLSQSEADDRLQRDFSELDKNKDGFLTENEMSGPPSRRSGIKN